MHLESRWGALLFSLLLPGSGHWASGRRVRGVAWFLVFPLGVAGILGTALSPRVPTALPALGLLGILAGLWIFMMISAIRGVPHQKDRLLHRPWKAGFLSFFIPGLGQFYNRQWVWGMFFLALSVTLAFLSIASMSTGPLWAPGACDLAIQACYVASIVYAVRARAIRDGKSLPIVLLLAVAIGGSVLCGAAERFLRGTIRTFKVASGSMAPTLLGPRVDPEHEEFNWKRFLQHGEYPIQMTARKDGVVEDIRPSIHFSTTIDINGLDHMVPADAHLHVQIGQEISRGDILASGMKTTGDWVVVDQATYRRRDPERGDMVVFSTSGLDHPTVRPNLYFIQRVVGLPGERVSINPSFVYINGTKLKEPKIFDDIANGRKDYAGYQTAHLLAHPPPLLGKDSDAIELGEGEYAVLGDRSERSLDSRYFGAIRREQIVGKVARVYWPFGRARVPE